MATRDGHQEIIRPVSLRLTAQTTCANSVNNVSRPISFRCPAREHCMARCVRRIIRSHRFRVNLTPSRSVQSRPSLAKCAGICDSEQSQPSADLVGGEFDLIRHRPLPSLASRATNGAYVHRIGYRATAAIHSNTRRRRRYPLMTETTPQEMGRPAKSWRNTVCPKMASGCKPVLTLRRADAD